MRTSEEVRDGYGPLPTLVGLKEAARILDMGRSKAYRLAQSGTFPVRVFWVAGSYKVSTHDLRVFLEGDKDQGQGS